MLRLQHFHVQHFLVSADQFEIQYKMFQEKHFPMKHQHKQSDLNPWYVTGICEIAGSFTYSRTMRNFAFYFAVKLPESQKDLLRKIRDFFGTGSIYEVRPTSGSVNSALYYRVTGIDQLASVIEHFDTYPVQGRNSARYSIWKEMVSIKQRYPRRKKLSQEDFNRLDELAQRLSQSSLRGFRGGNVSSETEPSR